MNTDGRNVQRREFRPRICQQWRRYHLLFVRRSSSEELPEYFDAWIQVGRNVASLSEQHKLRDVVDEMPLLQAGRLSGHRERRLAYMLLSIMGNGYVWQEGDAGVVKMVPRQLSVPWCNVADSLGLKPVISYPCLILSNCKLVGPNRELQTICQMPGDVHSDYFILHSAQIELSGVPGLKGILESMRCMASADEKGMVAGLEAVNGSLLKMTSTLTQLSQKMDPNVFYNQIRPFFSGWGGVRSPLPEGLIYEGVSDEPRQVNGGSGAQSPIVQCFDAALGITHEPEKQAFLDDMREFLMPHHRDFIEALRKAPSVRQYVKASSNKELLAAYNQCLDAFRAFRTTHIQLVAKFVVRMAEKWTNQDNYKAISELGTGGQVLITFLKTIRDTIMTYALKQ